MSNGIALVPVADIERMAAAVAASKLFGISDVNQAMSLMLIAQAEGMHPAIAARDYHVIQGRPALKADAMLARFQNAGGKVKWNAYTDEKVSGTFSHPSGGEVTIEWDMLRAKAAGLADKDNWKKYKRQMLRARTISEGVRTVCPGVTAGLYTPEEIQDTPHTERDMGAAEVVTEPQYITQEQVMELRSLLEGHGLSVADFCEAGQCESVPQLLASNFDDAKKWIAWKVKKKEPVTA
jgi:hypothetical protein